MNRAIVTILAVSLLMVRLLCAADADRAFGEPVNGLQLAIEQTPSGDLKLLLLNHGPEKAQLEQGFAWVLLAASRDSAFFTPKLSFQPAGTLKAGETRELSISVAQQSWQVYSKGAKVLHGYPQVTEPKAAAYADLPASLRAQAIAYVGIAGERVTVKSKPLAIMPHAQPASSQPANVAELIEQFRRDAFAAKTAHDRAVQMGSRAVPALKAALADANMPDFGAMWLATALVHIGGSDAQSAVVGLVQDPREGVRHVIAYHGPAMKGKTIDDAILHFASGGTDPVFTAWAARGFAEHGRDFPPGLVDAAFTSREPRARAEIAPVLAKLGDLKRLGRLCADEHELVRVAAADAVAANNIRDPSLLHALVRSLDLPGEAARQRAVEAAGKVLGRDWSYDPQVSEQQKLALFAEIRNALPQ